MSLTNDAISDFERNARAVLEHSVARIDARTRSRLNQARQAALEAVARPSVWWRRLALMPAGAVAAAVLVSVMLWHRHPGAEPAQAENQRITVEDMDLIADKDALDLMEGGDGTFYEWAAAQTDNGESAG